MRIRTVELTNFSGQSVSVCGWLHNVRRLGGITFLIVRDGWGSAQVVVEAAEEREHVDRLQLGSVVRVTGMVVKTSQAAAGVELQQPHIALISGVDEPPPFALHKQSLKLNLPTLLDNGVIANRHPQRQALFRMAAALLSGFRRALDRRHFSEIQSPKFVQSATESGANVFAVNYFGREAFLAQSPQFYKQIMVGVLERVYEVGPVFRAEPHDTSRHLTEYVSLDVEFGFIEDHQTVMRLVQELLAEMMPTLAERCAAEVALLEVALPNVPQPIPQIDFREAQALLRRLHAVDNEGEPDLSPQEERWLGDWARDQFNSDFLFVTGYPMSKRPFYTHPQPQNEAYSNSFDLLFRGLELITGGQRLHKYDDYIRALQERDMPQEPFAEYLQAFRHGMPPHGGFAIGLERLLMQLVQLPNVKLATLFPRDMTRLAP